MTIEPDCSVIDAYIDVRDTNGARISVINDFEGKLVSYLRNLRHLGDFAQVSFNLDWDCATGRYFPYSGVCADDISFCILVVCFLNLVRIESNKRLCLEFSLIVAEMRHSFFFEKRFRYISDAFFAIVSDTIDYFSLSIIIGEHDILWMFGIAIIPRDVEICEIFGFVSKLVHRRKRLGLI